MALVSAKLLPVSVKWPWLLPRLSATRWAPLVRRLLTLNSAQRVQRGVVAAIEPYRAAKGPHRACTEAAVQRQHRAGAGCVQHRDGVVGLDAPGIHRRAGAVVQWVASGHGAVGIDVDGLCRGCGGGQQAAGSRQKVVQGIAWGEPVWNFVCEALHDLNLQEHVCHARRRRPLWPEIGRAHV